MNMHAYDLILRLGRLQYMNVSSVCTCCCGKEGGEVITTMSQKKHSPLQLGVIYVSRSPNTSLFLLFYLPFVH